jgi:4-nitrophenyl phosphatase
VTWVLDLDGVVWRGAEPIAGAVEAIRRLKDNGIRVTYVTNNSAHGAVEQVKKMARMGIDTSTDDIISAQDMLIARIGSNRTLLCTGAPLLVAALRNAGNTVLLPAEFIGDPDATVTVQDIPDVDAVVVGQCFDATYLQYSVAARAVMQCGRLLAPNRDPLYPHPSGMLLGTGSVVAMLENATGVKAEVVGKPEQAMVDELRSRIPDAQLVVGDQFSTDGELARKANIAFALVETGVDAQRSSDSTSTPVAHRSPSLATLVETLL